MALLPTDREEWRQRIPHEFDRLYGLAEDGKAGMRRFAEWATNRDSDTPRVEAIRFLASYLATCPEECDDIVEALLILRSGS